MTRQGAGSHGRFTITGIDRIRLRDDGKVEENYVVFDTEAFQARAGIPIPWA